MDLHRLSHPVGELFFFLWIESNTIRRAIWSPGAEHVVLNPVVHHIRAHGKLFGNLANGQFPGQLQHGAGMRCLCLIQLTMEGVNRFPFALSSPDSFKRAAILLSGNSCANILTRSTTSFE